MGASTTEELAISKWLEHKGYPFESRVADLCEQKGFEVVQAARYGDPVSGKNREVDVIAWRHAFLDEHFVELSVSYVFECKLLPPSIPWVLLTHRTPTGYHSNRFGSLHSSKYGSRVLYGLSLVSSGPRAPLLQIVGETGYALIEGPSLDGVQVPKGRPDPGDSVLQVTSAAEGRANFANTIRGDPEVYADIVIPVIALAGRLYKVEIANGVAGPVTRIQRGLLLLRTRPDEGWYRLVYVVSRDDFDGFLEDARATADRIIGWGGEALKAVRKEERSLKKEY